MYQTAFVYPAVAHNNMVTAKCQFSARSGLAGASVLRRCMPLFGVVALAAGNVV